MRIKQRPPVGRCTGIVPIHAKSVANAVCHVNGVDHVSFLSTFDRWSTIKLTPKSGEAPFLDISSSGH
jgi:hypothetical protein